MRKILPLLLSLFAANAMACTIKVVYSEVGSPPWFMGDGTFIPPQPGVAVELADIAAAKMQCKIAWLRLPNRRVQKEMEEGGADGMLMFSFNAERAAFAVYPMQQDKPDNARRLATLTYRIYVREDSKLQWDGKQFTNLDTALGANAGYSVGADLRKSGLNVEEVAGTDQNLKKLKQGRIAGYVMQEHSADPVIETMQLTGLRKLEAPYSTKDYFLPFSKRFYDASSSKAEEFWKLLAEARNTHANALLKKYSTLP